MRRDSDEHPRHPAHPLAETCARIRGGTPGIRFAPHGAGWHRLGAVVPATVGNWVEEVAAARLSCPQGRYVAGAFLGAQLARAVLVAPTLALATERRAPDVADLAVHRAADATIEGVGLVRPRFGALRGDPAGAHPDAVVFEEMAPCANGLRNGRPARWRPSSRRSAAAPATRCGPLWGQAADRVGGGSGRHGGSVPARR